MWQFNKNTTFILILLFITACSQNGPSELFFQNRVFEFSNTKDTKGNFDSLEYKNGEDKLFLIVPHKKELVQTLPEFSRFSTKSFIAQGFRFSSNGTRHIGVRNDHVIYIAVSKYLDSLAIFITPDGKDYPRHHGSASEIFEDLESLR